MARSLSIEDGNLSVSTIIGSRNRQYKDIDLTFTAKQSSGEIFNKTDASAVKQSVKNLCMTNFGEKPFLPEYGADIQSMLFELADDETESDIEDAIIAAIATYEPRALIKDVFAVSTPDRNSLNVTIQFQVVNTQEEVILSIALARLR